MQITLQRLDQNSERTFGRILVEGRIVVPATLEEPDRGNAKDVSCIPVGAYRWKKVISPLRGLLIIELEGVPGRTNIQLHIGNTLDDTLGCILLGGARGFGVNVVSSGPAYLGLMRAVRSADSGVFVVENKFDA